MWEKVFKGFAEEADNEYAMIDSTIVRAHQHNAGARKKTKIKALADVPGGLSTKIHATCDALGFHLTPGQDHDL